MKIVQSFIKRAFQRRENDNLYIPTYFYHKVFAFLVILGQFW